MSFFLLSVASCVRVRASVVWSAMAMDASNTIRMDSINVYACVGLYMSDMGVIECLIACPSVPMCVFCIIVYYSALHSCLFGLYLFSPAAYMLVITRLKMSRSYSCMRYISTFVVLCWKYHSSCWTDVLSSSFLLSIMFGYYIHMKEVDENVHVPCSIAIVCKWLPIAFRTALRGSSLLMILFFTHRP